MLSKVW